MTSPWHHLIVSSSLTSVLGKKEGVAFCILPPNPWAWSQLIYLGMEHALCGCGWRCEGCEGCVCGGVRGVGVGEEGEGGVIGLQKAGEWNLTKCHDLPQYDAKGPPVDNVSMKVVTSTKPTRLHGYSHITLSCVDLVYNTLRSQPFHWHLALYVWQIDEGNEGMLIYLYVDTQK